MAEINFVRNQQVKVHKSHNQFTECNKTVYTIQSIDKIQGMYSCVLLKDNQIIGAIPMFKLKAA
jgi:hypothetical protein